MPSTSSTLRYARRQLTAQLQSVEQIRRHIQSGSPVAGWLAGYINLEKLDQEAQALLSRLQALESSNTQSENDRYTDAAYLSKDVESFSQHLGHIQRGLAEE